jgi:hypothetical protein
MKLSRSELLEVANRIAKKSPLKPFPEFYLKTKGMDPFKIPYGEEVTMFRKDEFTVVMVGSEPFYFMSHNLAKFIFFAAKRGEQTVMIPDIDSIATSVKLFENDLDITLSIINKECRGLDDSEIDTVKHETSSLLGYSEIF